MRCPANQRKKNTSVVAKPLAPRKKWKRTKRNITRKVVANSSTESTSKTTNISPFFMRARFKVDDSEIILK